MFEEGTKVSYLDMQGTVNFIAKNYVVIELNPSENRNPAKLLVYRQYYSEIRINN